MSLVRLRGSLSGSLLSCPLLGLLALTGAGCSDGGGDDPPQIQPSLNPVNFQNFNPGAEAVTQEIIFLNSGDGTLEITGLDVHGDQNCALQGDLVLDTGLPTSLTNQDQAFLRFQYLPGGNSNAAAGTRDHLTIDVTSNSALFPVLSIHVCGCIVDGDIQAAPPCSECDDINVALPPDCPG